MALRIDKERYRVSVDGKEVYLPPKQFDLLVELKEADGRVLSRQALMRKVWGVTPAMKIETRTIDQHLARLRKKLRKPFIQTVPTRGYRFVNVK